MSLIQPHIHDEQLQQECAFDGDSILNLFPDVHSQSILTCLAAWMGATNYTDDLVEGMAPVEAERALRESVSILQGHIESIQDSELYLQLNYQAILTTC